MSVFPPLTIEIYSDIVYRTISRSSQTISTRSVLLQSSFNSQHFHYRQQRSTCSVTLNDRFMPQFWIAIFFILLAATQLYQSIKDINLPFPVYLVLGTVLAVAANSQHKFGFIPTQQVTLQEIKASDPVLTAQTSPTLTAIDNHPASAQIEATSESKQLTGRATPDLHNTALTPNQTQSEPKKPRTRKKAAPKSKQA
jgi:hypothetical protein